MAQFFGGQVGLVDEFIHFGAIVRLSFQNSQSLVDPIQQQTGLFYAFQTTLQFAVPKTHFQIHLSEQRVQIPQRVIQFRSNRIGETFQRPCDIPVLFQEQPCVVIHTALLFLLGLPNPFVLDLIVSQNSSLRQNPDESIGLFLYLLFFLFV